MKNEQVRTKMIAELYVPAAQKQFDVRIPAGFACARAHSAFVKAFV